jgi:hypothetical protein
VIPDVTFVQFRTTEVVVALLGVRPEGGAKLVENGVLVVNGVDVTPFLIEETRK